MAVLPFEKQKAIDNAILDVKLRTGLSYPENSLLDIVKTFGLDVFEIDMSKYPTIKGIIEYKTSENDKPKIFINKDLPAEGKTFTLAHEFGHFLLHKGQDKFRIDQFDYSQNTQDSLQESEANYFAASLLVPKEKLLKILSVTHEPEAIAKYFGVSKPVIETRLQWIKKNNF